MIAESDVYEHSTIIDKNTIKSRFLCVHNDMFYRCFKTTNEIMECLTLFNDNKIKIDFKITVVSKNKANEINVFLLDIFYKESVENLEDFSRESRILGLSNLEWVYYYDSMPCAFNSATAFSKIVASKNLSSKNFNTLYYDNYTLIRKDDEGQCPRILAELYEDELKELYEVIQKMLNLCPKK